MSTPTNRGAIENLSDLRIPTNGVGQVSAQDVRAVIAALTTSASFRFDNLSDLMDAGAARGNLGLGSAAVQGDDRYAHRANNLSDLASATTARSNLGLGSAATQADTRYAHRSNNLSDLANAATARANLGANDAANLTTGTLADARLPTSQAGKTFTSPVNHASGTASLPGVTFSGDTDTGMFRPGANTLAWATGGTERVRIDSAGNVGIGTSAPSAKLDVSTDALIHGITIGRGAGADVQNTAVGLTALFNNTTGTQNTAVGRSVLFSNTTGDQNTAIGRSALFNNTEGNQNTAIGRGAGNADLGDNNTIIGSVTGTAGMSNTVIIAAGTTERLRIDGAGNILIGTSATGASKLRVVGLPTSSAGLSAGDVWNDGGTLKIAS